MTFALGRAELILDVSTQPALEKQAQYYSKTRKNAEDSAKAIANAQKVEINDVRQAATIIIQARAKLAAEAIKIERERLKAVQESTKTELKYYSDLYKEEIKLAQQAAKEREAATKAQLKINQDAYNEEQKRTKEAAKTKEANTKTLLKYNQEQYAQEEKLRQQTIAADIKQFKDNVRVGDQRRAEAAKTARAIIAEEEKIEKARIASLNKQLAAEKRARDEGARARAAEASKQVSAGGINNIIPSNIGGTAATLLGFGAIASSAVIAHEAIARVTEATLKQEEAVRSLTASYGPMAEAFKKVADDNAAQFNRLNSDVEKGVSTFGILQKQYGTTGAEVQKLTKIAIDLNAAYGGDLLQTFRDVSNAIQGEPQALEKYGIALQQNAIKNSDLLTESEKRLYESMSAVEQARIRLRVLFDAAKSSDGEAAKRAKEIQGGFDALARSSDELAKTLGTILLPGVSQLAREFSKLADATDSTIKKYKEYRDAVEELKKEGNTALTISDRTRMLNNPFTNLIAAGIDITQIPALNAKLDEIEARKRAAAASKAYEDNWKQRQIDLENQARVEIELQNTKLRKMGDRLIEASKQAAELRIRDLDEQKKAAEAERDVKLRLLEEVHKQNIIDIQDIEYERKQASNAELARITAERDAKLKASDAAKDVELAGIEATKDAVQSASEESIRLLEIEKDHLKTINEEALENTLKRLETEKRARDHAREDEDRKIADAIKKTDRQLEDAHKKKLRQIEDEKKKEQDKYSDEADAIDKKADKEEKLHLKNTRRIEDESKEKLQSIQAEIDGIEKVEKTRDDARKKRDLAEKVADARRTLTRALGTGTPEQIVQARGKLTAAIRINDPEAIKKAEAELVEISSKGAEAIEKAQRDLRDAEEDLLEANREQTINANKEILESRKDSVSKQLEIDKRAEDDRNRARRNTLEADKKAAKDRTDDEIDKIEKRKRKLDDAYESDTRGAKDAAEKAKRILDDRRRNEDEQYKDSQDAARQRYEDEQERIEETYNSEERGLIPAIRRATKTQVDNYGAQKTAVENRYKQEREDIENTYNNPETGLLAVHRQAEEAAQHRYSKELATAQARYDAEQKRVKDLYDNPDGVSGILNRLERLKTDTQNALKDDIVEWDKWKEGLVGDDGVISKTFAEAQLKLKKFLEAVENRGGLDITYRPPTRRPENPPEENSGSQSGGGGGGGSAPPTHTNNSSPPTPEPSQTTNEVDVSSGSWPVEFGFNRKYTGGNFATTPGFAADGNIAVWPGGPTRHKGVDLKASIGTPVGSFTDGRVVDTQYDPKAGGRIIVVAKGDKAFWYMHLDRFAANKGDEVKRGQLIAYSGESGTEGAPHLHFEVRTGYPPLNIGATSINDLDNGVGSIDPMPYINQHDAGYLFRNPTYTVDSRTGELGQIAERGPEQLLGRAETARLNMNPISRSNRMSMDYAGVGAVLSSMSTSENVQEGDVMNYYGVAPDNVMDRWRDDQRRQRVLRGRR